MCVQQKQQEKLSLLTTTILHSGPWRKVAWNDSGEVKWFGFCCWFVEQIEKFQPPLGQFRWIEEDLTSRLRLIQTIEIQIASSLVRNHKQKCPFRGHRKKQLFV